MTRCTGKCPHNTSIDFPSTIALPLPQFPPHTSGNNREGTRVTDPHDLLTNFSALTAAGASFRPRSYDEQAIAHDLTEQLYLHTRHGALAFRTSGGLYEV